MVTLGGNLFAKGGVRQGDHLSALLFVLAAELLQYVINEALQLGNLTMPITLGSGKFLVVQYADDTILLLSADRHQILFLKNMLDQFAASTVLKVNYHKSYMIPLNVLDDKKHDLASVFGCQIPSMPFTYLGLRMGTTKPHFANLTPLMDGVERKLVACSSFLSYTGRLEMINSVISSTVTYAMCSIKLPVGVIENIERIQKQCLWRGDNPEKKGGNLAAWHMVQKPKHKGGLGVINLKLQNDAFLLKQLHKFYNHLDIPWIHLIWQRYYNGRVPHASPETGSFWWKDVLRLQILYRGVAKCSIGNGSTVTFWKDLWLDEVLSQKFPRLFSFVKNGATSAQQVMLAEDLDSLFYLPMSTEAFDELQQLPSMLNATHYHPDDSTLGCWFGVAKNILLEDTISWCLNIFMCIKFSSPSGSPNASHASNSSCGSCLWTG
jgi:hypothetical protein